jgi:hypothetical protein
MSDIDSRCKRFLNLRIDFYCDCLGLGVLIDTRMPLMEITIRIHQP